MVLPTPASWTQSFFDLGEAHSVGEGDCTSSESDESYTTYSTESSDGFMVNDNFMIITHADTFDEMSDIVDSVSTSSRSGAGSISSLHTWRTKRSNTSHKKMQQQLAAITEEDESDPCEAYLRAKMITLWTRIQELAKKEDLTATPLTDQDEELLKAYDKKNSTLSLLKKRGY